MSKGQTNEKPSDLKSGEESKVAWQSRLSHVQLLCREHVHIITEKMSNYNWVDYGI
jgi:hypothetical protein